MGKRTRRKVKSEAARFIQVPRLSVVAFGGLVIAIVISGLSIVEDAAHTRVLYQSLGNVQKEHDQLLEEHSRLSLERSTRSSLQTIESVAREGLGMEFPASIGRLDSE